MGIRKIKSRGEGCHDVLTAGADAEFSSPDAYAAGNIVLRAAFLQGAKSVFVNQIFNPRQGLHLAIVGVSAKLKVNAVLLRLFQVVGLVVKQYRVLRGINTLHQLR